MFPCFLLSDHEGLADQLTHLFGAMDIVPVMVQIGHLSTTKQASSHGKIRLQFATRTATSQVMSGWISSFAAVRHKKTQIQTHPPPKKPPVALSNHVYDEFYPYFPTVYHQSFQWWPLKQGQATLSVRFRYLGNVDVLQLWVQQTTWRYFDGDIMGIF
jgi:hypothetical protein